MKKNISAIVTICLLLYMCLPSAAFAAEDHGGEAHSPSMSVESGEDPISDISTTEDTGKVDAGTILEDSSGETEDPDAGETGDRDDEDAGDEKDSQTGFSDQSGQASGEKTSEGPSAAVYAGIVAVVIAVIAALLIGKTVKSARKEKYHGRH